MSKLRRKGRCGVRGVDRRAKEALERLRRKSSMVQEVVTKEYERLGVKLHKQSSQSKIERDENTGKLTVHYKDKDGEGAVSDVDHLIWAIGRNPLTKDIGLDKAGIKVNDKGYIEVDEYQNTSVDNIYALGDVTGQAECERAKGA